MLTVGTTAAHADAPFPDGANALFAGHSFFAPVADAFDAIATDNGYSDHDMQVIFRSGPLGSPAALWSDEATRNQMIEALSAGDVDLFGLTSFVGIGSSFEDYQLWFDTALSYNPDTTFFIGNPWLPGGARTETQAYDQAIEQSALNTFEIVEGLREAYPDSDIIYIDYGKTASVMKAYFDAGELPDIEALLPDPTNGVALEEALFEDNLGHGGPMMLDLAALSWMEQLYAADTGSLTLTPYESDIETIVDAVVAYNQPFVPEPGSLAVLAVGGLLLARRRRS